MDRMIRYQLENLAKRYRSQVFACLLILFWAILLGAILLRPSQNPPGQTGLFSIGFMAGLSLIGAGLLFVWTRFGYRDLGSIAHRIENRHPDLNQKLLTAIEPKKANESEFLRNALIKETLLHAKRNPWMQMVPGARLLSLWILQWLLLLGVLVTPWILRGGPSNNPSLPVSKPQSLSDWIIEPGNTQIEKGTDLIVSVRFPENFADPLHLITQSPSGESQRVTLQRSFKDPIASATLRRVNESMQYRIESSNKNSDPFTVDVFEHPSVVQSDALIKSPAYANQEDKNIANTRRVSIVDGASVQWTLKLNKPVSSAEWIDKNGQSIALTPTPEDPTTYLIKDSPVDSMRYQLRLTDDQGRKEKASEEFVVKLIPNREPEVKLTSASDQRVSPIQEMVVGAKIKDDFGIHRAGVSVAIGESEPIDVDLTPNADDQTKKTDLQHLIDLESMAAKADQLVTYHFWTEDLDRDGQPRRVDSEIFFAEVRPFEEIFREGDPSATQQRQQQQQQQQQGSQGAQQAEELAELQKKIISGTWNLIRGQPGRKTEERIRELTDSIAVLLDSQQQAIEQSEKLKESLQSADAQQDLLKVQSSMTDAISELNKVDPQTASVGLRDAIKPMRAAYEGLLRLRAREHEVTQNQQQQSSSQRSQSASQSSRQQQIQQLQLEQDPSRYEEESQPIPEESQSEREMRQVMNRLDELARRQQDLNEQVRELDLALQAAENQQEKRDLQDRLDRLREEQQELVQDADELLERMNNPETRSQLEESRQQIENARQQMQQSEEQLRNAEPSAALNSGTRAQANVEQTREQLRKQSSEALQKDVQKLVDQAQKVVDTQSQLQQQLQERTGISPNPSSGAIEPVQPPEARQDSLLRSQQELDQDEGMQRRNLDAWKEQKKEYQDLMDRIKDTVEQAEGSEPLLAEQLYETYRQASQQPTDQRLDRIPMMIERGMDQPAVDEAQEVSKELQGLRDRIAESTKSVLGSEEESLRRALQELQKANRAIENEMSERRTDSQDGQPQDGQPQDGQPQDGQPQDGQPQDGQPRDGQPRRGQQNRAGRSVLEQLEDRIAQSDGGARQLNSPLTGEDYAQWTDRLRDIEELVRDPDLRAQAARVREAAREFRMEYKRHSKEPQWDMVKKMISSPLQELQRKVQEELVRKTAKQNELVPLDRDPVPEKYRTELDRYFERLGEERSK
ncbi:MAG: hypothetical protein KGS49_06140 [Planctomycetes bacterium]|nr:hypothetical protein [Planctomycetota bacterium]